MNADPLQALLVPFENGFLKWPGSPALFINGEVAPGFPSRTVVQQYFRPLASGASPQLSGGVYPLVFLLAGRQQQETRYFIGQALERLAPGGALVCAGANDAGGKRLKGDLVALGLKPEEAVKHKSRVVWAVCGGEKAPEWIESGGPRPVLGGAFISQPGIFGWDKEDAGSALLARCLPDGELAGVGADFGCGYGYLSAHILRCNPRISEIFCLDADYRAVEMCRRNAAAIGAAKKDFVWADLTRAQQKLPPLDFVVMNPPFHEGKKTQPDVGAAFIGTAAAALKKGGVLWMVANVHLPYEAALQGLFRNVRVAGAEKGFKVFHATK